MTDDPNAGETADETPAGPPAAPPAGAELQPHPLLAPHTQAAAGARLQAGAAPPAHPDVVGYTGYLYPDAAPDRWRLYESLDLSAYLLIAGDDIVSANHPAPGDDQTRPSVVFVRRAAHMDYHRTTATRVQAGFLGGDLLDDTPGAPRPHSPRGGGLSRRCGSDTCTLASRQCPTGGAVTE